MAELFHFNLEYVIVNLVRVLIAFLLAFPIGWERSNSTRRIGVNTFPLVAIASCGFNLIAENLAGGNADVISRVLPGIITGIGFIGGGAILKGDGNVRGLATAASIWNTGAIGMAVASGQLEIGIVLCLINFVLLRMLTPKAQNDI